MNVSECDTKRIPLCFERHARVTTIIELEPTASELKYAMAITHDHCVGPVDKEFMFGGVGLGAGLAALERAIDQPVILVSAHFLSFARPLQVLNLDVCIHKAGRYINQCTVDGTVDSETLFRLTASVGARPDEVSGQWQNMPLVPPPEDCPVGQHWRRGSASIHNQLDVRVARGNYGRDRAGKSDPEARLHLWVRPKSGEFVTAPFLAIVADLIPGGVGNALGMNAGGNSLDITLRLTNAPPTEWILVEVCIQAISSGLVHGIANLYNENGDLLGMASQSLILRIHPPTDRVQSNI